MNTCREHQEEEDKRLEKIVHDAIDGKMRTRKRQTGLGFEDSDSESDDDTRARRLRPKKRKVEGDTLEAMRECF